MEESKLFETLSWFLGRLVGIHNKVN